MTNTVKVVQRPAGGAGLAMQIYLVTRLELEYAFTKTIWLFIF
jgi:hypothetical protein